MGTQPGILLWAMREQPGPPTPFTVLSHHRSGSNFVVAALRAHPAVACLNEPLAQHLDIFVHRDLEVWPRDPPLTVAPLLSASYARAYLGELRRWLCAADTRGVTGHQTRGFKETRLAEKISWFEYKISKVSPVLLARDPRSVTSSILLRPSLIDYWIPAHQLAHAGKFANNVDPNDLVARSAAIWAFRYSRLLDELDGSRYMVLRLESLVEELATSLTLLNNYLHLPCIESQAATVRGSWSGRSRGGPYSNIRDPGQIIHGWRSMLSDRDSHMTLAVAGDVMERLGYPTRVRPTA